MAIHLKPLGDHVLVEPVEEKEITNYDVCYVWDDRAWFTGAWLCLLSPFLIFFVWRLLKHVRRGGE